MKRILSSIAIASLFLFGCGETDPIMYNGEPDGTSGVYFSAYNSYIMGAYGNTYLWTDTMNVISLASIEVNGTYRMRVPISLFGELSDQDRPIPIKVANSTAVEGEGFRLVESSKVLEAGKASANVYLEIVNTPDLADGLYRYITLELGENEYFKPYIKSQMSGADTINTQTLTVPYYMAYALPSFYSIYAEPYWGAFSNAKMGFMLEVMGWTYTEFRGKNLYGVAEGMAVFAQMELQKRADAGNPMREADGSLMQLAGAYVVDYSAYE